MLTIVENGSVWLSICTAGFGAAMVEVAVAPLLPSATVLAAATTLRPPCASSFNPGDCDTTQAAHRYCGWRGYGAGVKPHVRGRASDLTAAVPRLLRPEPSRGWPDDASGLGTCRQPQIKAKACGR